MASLVKEKVLDACWVPVSSRLRSSGPSAEAVLSDSRVSSSGVTVVRGQDVCGAVPGGRGCSVSHLPTCALLGCNAGVGEQVRSPSCLPTPGQPPFLPSPLHHWVKCLWSVQAGRA